MNRLILYLFRKKLGVKKFEQFRFTNQKDPAVFFFSSDRLIKNTGYCLEYANVSLNWLLNDNCKVHKTAGEWRKVKTDV